MPRKVIIFGTDLVPLTPTMPASGAGLRIWQLYSALREEGFNVVLSLSEAVCRKYAGMLPEDLCDFAHTPEEASQREVLRQVQPDVVVACHWPNWHLRTKTGVPLVIDFHGPHLFERHFQRIGTQEDNVAQKKAVLNQGSFFTCAGVYQRDYFAGWLLQAGFMPDRDILATIPISLPPALPEIERSHAYPVQFVYSGFFLPWQDPFEALTTVVSVLEQTGRGKLALYGGPHPVFHMDTRRFDSFRQRYASSDVLHFHDPVSRAELLKTYATSDVALDVMSWNPERELAFTTRTVEYLWSGLPVIYNNYAELAEYIRDYEAGWCITPGNVDELTALLLWILEHPQELERYSRNAQRLARACFTWDRTIKPLADFCRSPRRPKRLMSPGRSADDFQNVVHSMALREILPPSGIEQECVCMHDNLRSVSVMMATFARSNSSAVEFILRDSSANRTIMRTAVSAATIQDNAWFELPFEPIADSAGHRLIVEIRSPDAQSGNAVTAWSSPPRGFPFGALR
jgi:glycosyltransferase involved in cell wall biosynthesis